MFEKVSAIALLDRIGVHSHINGLGMDSAPQEDVSDGSQGLPAVSSSGASESGIIGREKERKMLFLLSKLVESHKGRTILITGETGTGKSALEYALSLDLKRKGVPCKAISASEIFSSSLSKTEALTQAIRESLGIRVQETTKVLEGEVVEIQCDREKGISGRVILKTTEMEAAYTFGAGIIQAMNTEKVEIGDIVTVNKSTGMVRKKGRSLSQNRDQEAIGPVSKYIPCPEGEILRVQTETHTVTLHEIDILNSKQDSLRMTSGEIPMEIREAVNNTMKEWIEEGRGTLVTGVLFINESDLLDTECYSFLNTLSEISASPVIILSTNKSCQRGSSEASGAGGSAYGMPADFYSRVLEMRLNKYTKEEIYEIIKLRAKEESEQIETDGIHAVCDLAVNHGLRYAFNILSALDAYAARIGKSIGASEVGVIADIFPPVHAHTS
ncbi:RuvB-like protein 2 [Nematocida ausubeli]|nr:RuvB-like protein 2 [Nematocida ausubeli]